MDIPLSDYNKIVATNIFVNSAVEYFMWSEKFNIGDIREIDTSIREILNQVKAKYMLQANSSLYIPRNKGGRGLKKLETIYKKTKVIGAINLLTSNDPRMECVKIFEKKRVEKGRSSIITDAVRYAEDYFDIIFEPLDNNYLVHYQKNGENVTASNKQVVKKLLTTNVTNKLIKELCSSKWQGVILNTRHNDPDIKSNECFAWLTHWKDAPVEIINDIRSIYLQIVPTLTFTKYRGESIISTVCRLCFKGNESVKHLLSNCSKFVPHAYKRRHDRVLQYILFKYLNKNKMINHFPPWYTKISIKPMYKNEKIQVYWDIPEYSGHEVDLENGPLRPDGKIINESNKSIFVLEMSIPWIENRNSKSQEKEEKYINIVQSLKVENPGYIVKQLTFIIDCMGGYSNELIENLKLLEFTRSEIDYILSGIQKILVTEANSVINHFKILTMK